MKTEFFRQTMYLLTTSEWAYVRERVKWVLYLQQPGALDFSANLDFHDFLPYKNFHMNPGRYLQFHLNFNKIYNAIGYHKDALYLCHGGNIGLCSKFNHSRCTETSHHLRASKSHVSLCMHLCSFVIFCDHCGTTRVCGDYR